MKVEIKNIRREPDGKWTYDFTAQGIVNVRISLEEGEERSEVENFDVGYEIKGSVYGRVITDYEIKIDKDVRVDPETFKRIKEKIEKEAVTQLKEVLKVS